MTLSDYRGDDALDLVADLIAPISAIASDEQMRALFEVQHADESDDKREVAAARLAAGVPVVVKRHRHEVFEILARVKGIDVEEYAANASPVSIIADTMSLLSDSEVVSFFASLAASTSTDS